MGITIKVQDNVKIANRSLENVAQFWYLGMIMTNQYLIHEEDERRLDSGNACYRTRL
jgi:hypothetical protein